MLFKCYTCHSGFYTENYRVMKAGKDTYYLAYCPNCGVLVCKKEGVCL